jgi:CTP:molybdopterin cytidylyltransferase MocA
VRYADFAPVILAAGASSRMGGRPKELLEFDGVTPLELALQTCHDAGCGTPIVVTRSEREATVRDHLKGRSTVPAKVVVNPWPERGQTSSLRIGLAHLPAGSRAFLVFPVDFPLIRAGDVEALCRIFAAPEQYSSTKPRNGQAGDAGEVDLVVPSFARRRGHPVLVRAGLSAALLALPPAAPAREVLSAPDLYTLYMEVDDDRVLCDMDTPEAYARCLERYRARVRESED